MVSSVMPPGDGQVRPLLDIRDLKTYFYVEDRVIKAVDGVSYDVQEGQALGVVGESGCGKSVTALSVMRLIPVPPGRIVGGRILFEGEDLLQYGDEQMRRLRGDRIAMIFQDPMTSLNPVLTINKQVSEVLVLHKGMSKAQARRRTIEMLQLVGIPAAADRVDDYPHQFSGGMRQRVMIAMALCGDPKLLIADEPTTALDVTIQAQIVDLVKGLRKDLGTAIVWITHDLGVVAGLCDRVVVMYAGRVVEAAPVKELYRHPAHPYTVGLLRSLPRVDDDKRQRLASIGGMPPDMIDLPDRCDFAPRCSLFDEATCRGTRPDLRTVSPGHTVACWRELGAAR